MDIHLEQLVYGSFPFWDRGYDVLARSPGCHAEWVTEVLAACQRFGEAPSGVTPAPALFSLRLPIDPRLGRPQFRGVRAIVGVEPLGVDDRGRPGALAFHALLVEPRDYLKAGANPFAFAGALRRDWSAETTLEAITWRVETPDLAASPPDPRSRQIIEALSKGRRVALESPEPIDSLAREVWPNLPESVRSRASVATWAFGNANRFDLVALPRLAGVELDRSYLDLTSIVADPEPEPAIENRRPLPYHYRRVLIVAILTGMIGAGWAWQSWHKPRSSAENPMPRPVDSNSTIGPAERSAERLQVIERLEDLADQLEIGESIDDGELLATISRQFHYRGPTLKSAELDRLAAESDPDRDRALDWHNRITRTFAADRPLPEDFLIFPLDNQIDRIAWSFHLAPSSSPIADLDALLEALTREGPIRPTPLAARYPALSDYARFLGKLPRRK